MNRGKMETSGTGLRAAENAPAHMLSDVALRVALWVVYGGAAGEMVYGSRTIEEGMGITPSNCSSRHAN
jgi:hypothetical protein